MDNSNQTSQAQQTVNPTPNPINNSDGSKLIPIILGVAVVAVIAIGAYILGTKQSQPVVQTQQVTNPTTIPTPIDPTANWKELSINNLEFKIPNSWWSRSYDGNKPGDIIFIINPTELPFPSDALPAYHLYFEKGLTVDQKEDEITKTKGLSNIKEENINISDRLLVTFEGIQPAGIRDAVKLKFAILSDSTGVYTLTDENNLANHDKYFDQILSTFQFSN